MPFTHCTGTRGCGGWYNTDKCGPCDMGEWTPEELEEFRTSDEWATHEAKAHVASKKGSFGSIHHTCGCGVSDEYDSWECEG